ncbi:MAG TPA: histidine kinase [Bryobacteraceae bacterium]|nr:histidine kinase [Bryobacteraceae bacterium]
MPGLDQPLLINILGHAAGALIFAIFLALLFSGRGWSGSRGRNLSALAAALSLVWNLGSLAALVRPGMPPAVLSLVVAVSFSVLSLLPAVLLHISLKDSQPALVVCGYVLSGLAVAMHFLEIAGNGASLHQLALLLITAGFLLLAGIAAARVALRRRTGTPSGGGRILASMCLALFAMSFVHFGAGHASHAWSSELVVHHAGIPLALFVLLQDYRFVLLDAFVRFLANALLAAVLTWLVIAATFRLALVERVRPGPLQEALLVIAVGLFLAFFAWLRDRLHSWLAHAVFLRGGMEPLAAALKDGPAFSDEQAYLDWAAARMAAAARTADYAVVPQSQAGSAAGLRAPAGAGLLAGSAAAEEWKWAETLVPVRLAAGDSRVILLGHRQGGRRYLGEDLDALARASGEVEERVESMRREEMNRLVAQAELRALESQINPHFLFNALNALYGAIPREAAGARRMVLNLADIFRYFLQSGKTFVTLAEEMRIVRAYLEVEKARLGDRLEVAIQADDAALAVPIPILSIQPLVENAIKHGVAPRTEPGYVHIHAAREGGTLCVTVENSGGDSPDASSGPGVGLQNVRRRLEICYGPAARLELQFRGNRTVVELSLPLPKPAGSQ